MTLVASGGSRMREGMRSLLRRIAWITPDGYFSVITPEAATAILEQPPSEAAAVANRLRLRPQDLVELGTVRGSPSRRPAADRRPLSGLRPRPPPPTPWRGSRADARGAGR